MSGIKRSRDEVIDLDECCRAKRPKYEPQRDYHEVSTRGSFLRSLNQSVKRIGRWFRGLFRRSPEMSEEEDVTTPTATPSITKYDDQGGRSSVAGPLHDEHDVDITSPRDTRPHDPRPCDTRPHDPTFHDTRPPPSSVSNSLQAPSRYLSTPVLGSVIRERETTQFRELIDLRTPVHTDLCTPLPRQPESVGPLTTTRSCQPTSSSPFSTFSTSTTGSNGYKLYSISHPAHNICYRPTSLLKNSDRKPFLSRDPSVALAGVQSSYKPPVLKGPLDVGSDDVTNERPGTATPTDSCSTRESVLESKAWLDTFKQAHALTTADRQARIDVLQKHALLDQENRMKADDERSQKFVTLMDSLKIHPWCPEIEEESYEELNFDDSYDYDEKVNSAWGRGRPDEVFAEGYSTKIRRSDLATLSGLEWLNDEIINFYINMVTDSVNKKGAIKLHCFNSFFYPKIMSAGYSGVRRWTKKVDIFSCDLVILPVHLGMHWCMAAIDFRHKTITYYDSLLGSNTNCLRTLRDYLCSESMDKRKVSYDVSDWKLNCAKDIPTQKNGSDCGVFTCMYVRHLAKGRPFNFSQEDMSSIRRLMAAEIIAQKLL